ncbi:MAG: RNA polymerase sigma factor [Bacteroidetes bacterium]|nr:RNA polymerase sigma factor [Bacteroidota bacterium]MBU1719866.1 RNA polymerase sigma factor [Bacteroidota bacterium]
MLSDKQIIEGCKAGKRKAQQLLYRKFHPAMMGICLRYCKSHEEAEDVLVGGFMTIFTKIKDYRGEGALAAWIRRIFVNAAIDHYRSNLKFQMHSDVAEIERVARSEPDFNAKMSADEIMTLVQQLPEGCRMVFNLYAIEGYHHKEIAEMLGISENTSKTQLLYARKLLQAKLHKLNYEPETLHRHVG